MFKTYDEIVSLVNNAREETQSLEFKKEFELDKNGILSRSAKREISKHIGGMSNAAGGHFIIGIETEKANGVDRAASINPIKGISFLADQIRAAIDNSLMPQRGNIEVNPIYEKDDDTGVILITVPKSSGEPCMSTASGEHRYYRRGTDGTYLMDHLHIKQQMFSHEAVSLECAAKIRWSGSIGATQIFNIDLTLKNIGALPAKNPIVQVLNGYLAQTDINSKPNRATADGRSYFLREQKLLFPGEEIVMATHQVFATPIIHEMKAVSYDDLLTSLASPQFWNFYDKNPKAKYSNPLEPIKTTQIKAQFAAENAALRHFEQTVDLKCAIESLKENEERIQNWLSAVLR